jgi:hypothetical protein
MERRPDANLEDYNVSRLFLFVALMMVVCGGGGGGGKYKGPPIGKRPGNRFVVELRGEVWVFCCSR